MSLLEEVQEEVKWDMTPMIDTVFLMIIFFVCIDFKVLESKLQAYLPKESGTRAAIAEPREQLPVRIYVESPGVPEYQSGTAAGLVQEGTKRPNRFVLKDHRVRWEVGPKPLYSVQELTAELKRIALDPSSQVPDQGTGGRKLLGCVIEAHPGTYYDDVAKTADACNEAGFREISFGSGLGGK
ncbi:MAG TPA: biopolymer transporter ExbD [Planctomycetota bacterium]|nr:biopolymer transporter ExbD [Planctomycetota bacterium]